MKTPHAPSTPARMLVVEDETDIREALVAIFAAEGEARGARDGAEAVVIARLGARGP